MTYSKDSRRPTISPATSKTATDGPRRWLAGIVLARSEGEGGYAHQTASGGSVTSTLTGLHPFAQYRFNGQTSVWGTVGYGVGDLALTPQGASESVDTDLKTAMAAFGGRGVLSVRTGASGMFELAVRSDAMLTRTESGASDNLLAATGATRRVRVLLEGTGSVRLGAHGVLTQTLEAGLRYDGGDAETGPGLEIVGGLSYALGRLTAQVNARMLAAHQDSAFEEWGYSGSVTFGPGQDGRGLAFSLGSAWGATQSGVQALWGRENASGLASGAQMDAAQRFQAKLSYGLNGPKGGSKWMPFVATDAGNGHKAYRLGVNFTSGQRAEAALEYGWRQATSGPPEQAVELRGVLRCEGANGARPRIVNCPRKRVNTPCLRRLLFLFEIHGCVQISDRSVGHRDSYWEGA